jgi:putative ABC transport system permease protein
VEFAWSLLAHRKRRTAVAVGGIAFAILFMFLQLGFSGALRATATAVSSRLDGDLVLVSSRFLHLTQSGSIPRSRLVAIRGIAEVEDVVPIYVRFARWKAPSTGRRCSMLALAFPPGGRLPLRLGAVSGAAALAEPGSVLADRESQEKCGVGPGLREVEVRERPVRVAGFFGLGVGFLGDGALLASDDTYAQLFAGSSLDEVHVGLVRLRPGASAEAAAASLRRSLPPDTQVLTRAELEAREVRYWVSDTSIGAIFTLGAAVGFCVGLMILYQVLSTDVRAQLPQYATLKAIGYSDRRIYTFVLQQSWLYAALGYAPGFLLSLLVYAATYDATRVPMAMTPARALGVLILSALMCTGSALLAVGRVRRADPAELY